MSLIEKLLKFNEAIGVFTQKLNQKRIPYSYTRVAKAIYNLMGKEPPEGFFGRLSEIIDFIDKNEFAEAFDQMVENIERSISGQYILIVKGVNKSGSWMYRKLLEKGIHPASIILTFDNQSEEDILAKLSNFKNTPLNFLIVDDWVISGGQIVDEICSELDHIISIANNEPQSLPILQIHVLFATEYARLKLMNVTNNIHIASSHKLKVFEEVMTNEDFAFLKKLSQEAAFTNLEFGELSSFALGWWKLPDTIPAMFTDPSSPYQLFSKDDFTPPYKIVES